MTEGLNVIKNLLSSFLPLFLAIIVPSVSPLYCSAIPRNAMGDGRGEGLIPLETRSERCITLSPCVPVREYRGSAHWARGLTFTVKNLLSSFLPLFLAIIVPSVSPLYCSAIPRNAMGDGRGEGLIPLETRSERCITLSPCVPVREYRGSAHWARGLTFTVKNLLSSFLIPLFRNYRFFGVSLILLCNSP